MNPRQNLDDDTLIVELRRMFRGHSDSQGTALAQVRRRRDPFRVLVSTILSQRTRDENTAKASERLFAKYPDVRAIAAGDVRGIERRIRPSGFYRVKARGIKKLAMTLLDRHQGRVPGTLEELLALPMVGRKTANCVLVYAFDRPAIPVDTHVHRVSNRLGIVNTRSPEETEKKLSEFLKRDYWIEINELMVEFGKTICRPIGPRCDICRLNRFCEYYAKNRAHVMRNRKP